MEWGFLRGLNTKLASDDKRQKAIVHLLVLVFAIITVPVYYSRVGSGVDFAWQFVLNDLFLDSDYRFGTDIFYTYGPLGFLCNPMKYNGCCWWGLAIYGLLFIGQIYNFRKIVWRNVSILCIPATGLLMLYVYNPTDYSEIYIQFGILLAIGVMWYESDKVSNIVYFLNVLLALYFKWTIAIGVAGTVIILSLYSIFKREYKRVIWFLLPYFFFPVSFLIYNGSWDGFVNYIIGGLEVSSGFNANMSIGTSFDTIDIVSYGVLLVLFGTVFINEIRHCKKNAVLMFAYLPCFFMAYKHGYVRQDSYHMTIAKYDMAISMITVFLNLELKPDYGTISYIKKKEKLLYSFIICFFLVEMCIKISCGIYGTGTVAAKANTLMKMCNDDYEDTINQISIDKNLYHDNLMKQIGDSTYTVISNEYTWVCLYPKQMNNALVMPLIQEYVAYSPWLDERNASFFRNEAAPEYIMITFGSIDERIPLLDMPVTWNAIYDNYGYCDSDEEFVLLKRNSEEQDIKQVVNSVFLAACKEETISVSQIGKISFSFKMNLRGRLAELFWKVPEVNMRVTYSDGFQKTGRIVVDNLSNGFYIDNVPYDRGCFIDCMQKKEQNPFVVKVEFYGEGLNCYDDDILVQHVIEK